MTLPEKKVENKIKKWLSDNGYYYIKTLGGSVPTGTPDIIACINGQFVGIEVKRPNGGVVSDIQKAKLKQIEHAEGIGIVANTLATLITELKRKGVI